MYASKYHSKEVAQELGEYSRSRVAWSNPRYLPLAFTRGARTWRRLLRTAGRKAARFRSFRGGTGCRTAESIQRTIPAVLAGIGYRAKTYAGARRWEQGTG